MLKLSLRLLVTVMLLSLIGCNRSTTTTPLFNGRDLAGWDSYVAPPADSLPPIGLNNDTARVFSVSMVDGGPAIRVSGKYFGGLSTTSEFENYHLSLEFKWGTAKIPSFKDRKRDSGLLYHAVGPHGVDAKAWMRSQELQIQEGDCGDYWGVAGGVFDVPAKQNEEGKFIYDPAGELLTFSAAVERGRRCIKSPDAEKPTGEWNRIELYCMGDTAIHIVNGVVVMRLYRSRQIEGNQELPLKRGKIQLQSEGCEVYYRSLDLEPIKEIPGRLLRP